MALFGLPFFLAGVFLLLAGLGVLPVKGASGPPQLLLLLMAIPFLGVGGFLAFGRRWFVFDASQGRVVRATGLLVPMRYDERSLSEFRAVAITRDSNSDSADTYPIRLRARTGKDLKLCSSPQFADSWARAEFLARFLNLELEDQSSDHRLVIEPGQAGETLQERLRSRGVQPERAMPPLTMRSEVEGSGAEVRITVPGRGWAAVPFAFGALIPLGIALYVMPSLLQFFRRTHTPNQVQFGAFGFLVLAFGLFPLLSVLHAVVSALRGRTVVTASRAGILIEKRGAWRTRTTEIPAEEILALDYSTADSVLNAAARTLEDRAREQGKPVPEIQSSLRDSRLAGGLMRLLSSKGITVKSRQGIFAFGEGLPGDELRYLQALISQALTRF
jgi:hypothetical protein